MIHCIYNIIIYLYLIYISESLILMALALMVGF